MISRSNCRAPILERFSLTALPFAVRRRRARALLERFRRDERAADVLAVALMTPVLIGIAGLGTETVWWLYKHKNMQGAVDSGAVSAATAASNLAAEANPVIAAYGYANGVNTAPLRSTSLRLLAITPRARRRWRLSSASRNSGCCRRCSAPILFRFRREL